MIISYLFWVCSWLFRTTIVCFHSFFCLLAIKQFGKSLQYSHWRKTPKNVFLTNLIKLKHSPSVVETTPQVFEILLSDKSSESEMLEFSLLSDILLKSDDFSDLILCWGEPSSLFLAFISVIFSSTLFVILP